MDKTALVLSIAGIVGAAILAYILLTKRAYAAPAPPVQPTIPTQPTPPAVEILDYEVY
jgi:hypothetical protein